MTKIRKRTSKRQTLKKKYKIIKKSKDHKRKLNKEAKKMKKAGIKPMYSKDFKLCINLC
jgi:hypothetical protein